MDRPSRKPDQHENQLRKLDQLIEGQKKLAKAIGEGGGGGKPIDINFSWPMDHELMQLVREGLQILKEIQERLAGGGGLTETQENELAGKLSGPTDALQSAVEANQP